MLNVHIEKDLLQVFGKICPSEIPHSPIMLGFCSDPVLWPVCHTHAHIHGEQTIKTHPQTCFPVFSNCPRPSHITCPLSPSQFHSSVQPASVPKLWPALCCLHSQLDLMTEFSFLASDLWSSLQVCTSGTHQFSLGFCTAEPTPALAQLDLYLDWTPRACHDCSYIQHAQKTPFTYEKDTTNTTSMRMQFELFLSQ